MKLAHFRIQICPKVAKIFNFYSLFQFRTIKYFLKFSFVGGSDPLDLPLGTPLVPG